MEATLTNSAAKPKAGTSARLLSLDVMRGLTVAGMILVNNAGGPLSYDFLRHSEWNGLTPCDLVFPFFLFIMGVTTYLSLSKTDFRWSGSVARKIARRSVLIILIGWALTWISMALKGHALDFGQMRLTGVLPRIGLCFGLTSLLALRFRPATMAKIAAGLLAAYTVAVVTLNGYAPDAGNFNAVADRFILGEAHLYHKSPIDPEGLVSTVSALAHTIVGFCFGAIIKDRAPLPERCVRIFAIGFSLAAAGFLMSEWLPLNKRIWSPTFALVTCGLAAMLLATLIYIIDMRGQRRWSRFFEMFGINPLFLYVFSEVAAIAISASGIKPGIYSGLSAIIPDPYAASAAYSMLFLLVTAAVALPLYRRRIIIKL